MSLRFDLAVSDVDLGNKSVGAKMWVQINYFVLST